MSALLYIITIVLVVFSVVCAAIFLWLNNFSARTEISERNKSLKRMMKVTVIASMITALLTGLLSDSSSVEAAIDATVNLYFIIAISMLVVILISCMILIYRFVSHKRYSESGVAQMLKTAVIGAVVSLVLAWLLS